MPKIPTIQALSGTSVEVLNAIRNSASQNYKDFVPYATPDAQSIKDIGAVIMQYVDLKNEFLSALVNRIGRVIVTSKLYSNPWAFMKRGLLEFGETTEEVFVDLAKPFQYDAETAEETVFKRVIPDVKAAFHVMNWQKFYKQTIQNNDLRLAFLSWNGITDLIARIVDAMYTGLNYDEFLTMKYLIARHILEGHFTPYEIAPPSSATAKNIVGSMKSVSNVLEFMSSDYNLAGVKTYTKKRDQFLIVNAKFDALIDVDVLASAFNMSRVEFMGQRVLVDSFGALDPERLEILFRNDPNYTSLTPQQLEALDQIPAVLIDRDFLFIVDNQLEFGEIYNPEGRYWNYFVHAWKTFSVSPFHNALVMVPGTPSVTSVTVSPATATVRPGQLVQFKADVVIQNMAPQAVNWSTNNPNIPIDNSGNLIIPDDARGTVTVTATSVYDPSVSGTATVTIA